MELRIPLDEAVGALRTTGTLPGAVREVHGEAKAVLARVAVHELPGVSGAVRAATRFTGPVDVRVDDQGISGRTWTLVVHASHPVVRLDLSGFVTDAVRSALASAPAGLASVHSADGRTVVEVDLDAAAALVPLLLPAAQGLHVRVDEVSLGATVLLRATITG